MPIDASIPLQARPPQLMTPADAISLQSLMAQLKAREQALADAQAEREQTMALKDVYANQAHYDPQGMLTPEAIRRLDIAQPGAGQKQYFAQNEYQSRRLQQQAAEAQLRAGLEKIDKEIELDAVNKTIAYENTLPPDQLQAKFIEFVRQGLINNRDRIVSIPGGEQRFAQAMSGEPDYKSSRSSALGAKYALDEAAAKRAEEKSKAQEEREDITLKLRQAENARQEEELKLKKQEIAKKEEGTRMPASASAKLFEMEANRKRAERAWDLVRPYAKGEKTPPGYDPEATGMKGFTPDFILQRTDPKGVDARAAVGDLGSLVIHERSGAAVTAAESPRLKPFIPLPTDDTETVRKKVKRFLEIYTEMVDDYRSFHEESGYKVPPLKSDSGKGASAPSPQAVPQSAPATPASKTGPKATKTPLTATNPTTGERIQSLDGGKTWQPMK